MYKVSSISDDLEDLNKKKLRKLQDDEILKQWMLKAEDEYKDIPEEDLNKLLDEYESDFSRYDKQVGALGICLLGAAMCGAVTIVGFVDRMMPVILIFGISCVCFLIAASVFKKFASDFKNSGIPLKFSLLYLYLSDKNKYSPFSRFSSIRDLHNTKNDCEVNLIKYTREGMDVESL